MTTTRKERIRAREIQAGWDSQGHAQARATLGLPEIPKGLISEDPEDHAELAKDLVRRYIEEDGIAPEDAYFDVFLTWFSYTLRSWKAIATTTLGDGIIYEITHSADRNETYLDVYTKIDNKVLSDTKPYNLQGDNA